MNFQYGERPGGEGRVRLAVKSVPSRKGSLAREFFQSRASERETRRQPLDWERDVASFGSTHPTPEKTESYDRGVDVRRVSSPKRGR